MYCIHANQAINQSSKEIQIDSKLGSKSRNLASHQISYITTHFIPDDAKRLVALLLPSASIVSSDAVEVELGVDPNINGCQSNKRDERCKFFHSKKIIDLDASRLGIYPPLIISPSGDSCILYTLECLLV